MPPQAEVEIPLLEALQEYIIPIIRCQKARHNRHNCQIDWYPNRGGRFEPVPPPTDGILCSKVFSGLWLDAAALVRRDGRAVQATLQQGLDAPEHADFVARLERNRPT
jgi:hypothetical protein